MREGIGSISLNPDAVVQGFETIAAAEREQAAARATGARQATPQAGRAPDPRLAETRRT